MRLSVGAQRFSVAWRVKNCRTTPARDAPPCRRALLGITCLRSMLRAGAMRWCSTTHPYGDRLLWMGCSTRYAQYPSKQPCRFYGGLQHHTTPACIGTVQAGKGQLPCRCCPVGDDV